MTPLIFFFHLYHLGRGSLASWDEAIYASVARDILRTGDWFRLQFEGQLWFDKPPLEIWATAFFYKYFGVNEFSARLFSALCGIGLVYLTYFLGRLIINRYVGLIGALVLLSSSHYLRFARFGMMDVPVTFFMTLSLYFFWIGHQKNRFLIYSGAAIGMALMTKGFTAALIFPVVWIYCWCSGRTEILKRPSYWIGIMLALIIALPWNFYELIYFREQYWRDVIMRHSFMRAGTALDGHVGSWYFYIRTLINKYHPWILVGIFSGPYFLFKAIKDREDEIIFLTVWMFSIFVGVTLIKTKLPSYVLPIYPALSLSVAYVISRIFQEKYAQSVRVIFILVLILHVPYSHIFAADYSQDIKGIAPMVNREVPPNKLIYLCNYHEIPAGVFYLDRRFAYLDSETAFMMKAKEKEFYCLLHDDSLRQVLAAMPKLEKSVKGSFKGLTLLAKPSGVD